MMMGNIAEWLQRIIAAVIVAGFLEMILPNNELKGVTKMIVGLMVIMILVQPVAKVFQIPSEIAWSLPTLNGERLQPSTDKIIKKGLELRSSWTSRFKEENQQYLEKKIRNILGMIDDIRIEKVQVTFDDQNPVGASIEVAPVDRTSTIDRNTIITKIKNSVQLVSNLTEERIEVIWDGRE
jgi:stage III sporulation protein AF